MTNTFQYRPTGKEAYVVEGTMEIATVIYASSRGQAIKAVLADQGISNFDLAALSATEERQRLELWNRDMAAFQKELEQLPCRSK